MDKEMLQSLKEDYLDHIKGYVNEYGNLFPHLSIFADVKEPEEGQENKPAIIHIPIPSEYMKDSDSKDKFVDNILPEIVEHVKEKFNPIAIGWAAEATMRVAGSLFDIEKDDWTKIPVSKEVIIITIDGKDNNQTFLYEVKQVSDDVLSNMKITESGQLANRVELIDITEKYTSSQVKNAGGRFGSLYKKFFD